MNIVYGGSFNPPTKAHKQIIENLLDMYSPEHLIIVPTSEQYTLKNNLIPIKYRIEMLKLLTTDKRVIISDFEEKTPHYQGTYKTLEYLKKDYDEIYFAMGADNLDYISSWLNHDLLIKSYKFIVIGRPGFNLMASLKKEVNREYHSNFSMMHFYSDVSSTSVRGDVLSHTDMLNDNIVSYIKKNKLYEV